MRKVGHFFLGVLRALAGFVGLVLMIVPLLTFIPVALVLFAFAERKPWASELKDEFRNGIDHWIRS